MIKFPQFSSTPHKVLKKERNHLNLKVCFKALSNYNVGKRWNPFFMDYKKIVSGESSAGFYFLVWARLISDIRTPSWILLPCLSSSYSWHKNAKLDFISLFKTFCFASLLAHIDPFFNDDPGRYYFWSQFLCCFR